MYPTIVSSCCIDPRYFELGETQLGVDDEESVEVSRFEIKVLTHRFIATFRRNSSSPLPSFMRDLISRSKEAKKTDKYYALAPRLLTVPILR